LVFSTADSARSLRFSSADTVHPINAYITTTIIIIIIIILQVTTSSSAL